MPRYEVQATIKKEATYTVVADNEAEAIEKVRAGDWMGVAEDQVIEILPNEARPE